MRVNSKWNLTSLGVIVSLLTAILGAVLWIGTEIWKLSSLLTTLQIVQSMNTTAIQELKSRASETDNNFQKMLWIISAEHNGGNRGR